MWKKILIIIVLIFVAGQFIPVNYNNPDEGTNADFIVMHQPPKEIESILRSSCYDCHSNQTIYPDYAKVFPMNLWIKHHIEEGREHLNFSSWASYSEEKANHKLEESIEEVGYRKMPMRTYILKHKEADLSQNQRELLIDYFKSLKK